jgi:hypothetical protein
MNKFNLIDWELISQAFLNTLESRISQNSKELIEAAIFNSGPAKPYENTFDFFYTYSSNLMNSQARGPRLERLGEMTRNTLRLNPHFFDGNNLKEFNLQDFCKIASKLVNETPLDETGKSDYFELLSSLAVFNHNEILNILNRSENRRKVMRMILLSINDMAQLLIRNYNGSASRYSEQFWKNNEGDFLTKIQAAQNFYYKLRQEANFLLMGPATAPNFFKDSQIGVVKNEGKEILDTFAGCAVKPDMHVFRLMLAITNRVIINDDEELQKLCHLPAKDYISTYQNITSNSNFILNKINHKVNSESMCIDDVRLWAFKIGVSPVEIDRILYMAGSGNPGEGNKSIQSQFNRYKIFLKTLNILNY